MGFLSIVLVACGLSMDAFAVAVGKGLNMKKMNVKWSLTIALSFGLFQAIMPLLGWLLGGKINKFICHYDHWVVFILLAIIGAKMIYESKDKDCKIEEDKRNFKELFVLSIATSIDAFAVGISFALMNINIFSSVTVIGIITFALSYIGILIGNIFGCKFKSTAELIGGLILIAIGLKVLLEHLNIF